MFIFGRAHSELQSHLFKFYVLFQNISITTKTGFDFLDNW